MEQIRFQVTKSLLLHETDIQGGKLDSEKKLQTANVHVNTHKSNTQMSAILKQKPGYVIKNKCPARK